MTFDETNMFDDVTTKEVPVGSIGYFGDTPSKIMYLIEENAKPSVLREVLNPGTLKRYITDAYLPDTTLLNREYIPNKEAYKYFYYVGIEENSYTEKEDVIYNFSTGFSATDYDKLAYAKGDSFYYGEDISDFLNKNNFLLFTENAFYDIEKCNFKNNPYAYYCYQVLNNEPKNKKNTLNTAVSWKYPGNDIDLSSQKSSSDLMVDYKSLFEMRPGDVMAKEIFFTNLYEKNNFCDPEEADLYGYCTFNNIVDDIFWQPKSVILRCLLKVLTFFTKISNLVLNFMAFVLNIVLFILKYPILVLSFCIDGVLEVTSQLSFDYYYSHTSNYKSCLQHSYMKAILTYAVIITAPFWIPFIWGAGKYGEQGFEMAFFGGLFSILCVFTLFGSSITTIAGILAIFMGHTEVEYTMSKHGYRMTDADLDVLDNAMTTAFSTWGISHVIRKVL